MLIEEAFKMIEDLKATLLFGSEDHDPVGSSQEATPIAQQHILLSMAALETAKCHMQLADYWNMRETLGRF